MTIHRINTVLAILLGTFVLPGQSFSECVEVGAGAMEDSYITYKSGGGINDQALDWGDRQKMLVGNFVNDAQFNADGTHDSSRDHAGVGVIKFDLSEIPTCPSTPPPSP